MDEKIQQAMDSISAQASAIQTTNQEKLRGERGIAGPQGIPGRDARIKVGNVQVGLTPSVTSRHDEITNTFTLDFVLPAPQRGAEGSRGEKGAVGPVPELAVGTVLTGNDASVSIRHENGKHVFDFVLPRGERGFTGARGPEGIGVPGPEGKPGKDSTVPGPIGPAGEAVKGDKGDPGLSRQEILATIVEILQTAGILSSNEQKLIEVRAVLRKKANQASDRHVYEISQIARDVDAILDK